MGAACGSHVRGEKCLLYVGREACRKNTTWKAEVLLKR